ncbi:hypothetical protein DQ04_13651010 [Trypanosoma grayi]|uniref:hypothetical protein n=1 Tax=Trypanosoma grayi TaxID=71804 RepID=UPI0004F4B501|nr:hypothetical protein DQ04_13651010 [Trypanosoma grayi]KEG06494.1 hypothetical protein DQ04_13651010 [Trypanosoma grayi]
MGVLSRGVDGVQAYSIENIMGCRSSIDVKGSFEAPNEGRCRQSVFVSPLIPSEDEEYAAEASDGSFRQHPPFNCDASALPGVMKKTEYVFGYSNESDEETEGNVKKSGDVDRKGDMASLLSAFEQIVGTLRRDLISDLKSEIELWRISVEGKVGDVSVGLPQASKNSNVIGGRRAEENVGHSRTVRAHLANAFRKDY